MFIIYNDFINNNMNIRIIISYKSLKFILYLSYIPYRFNIHILGIMLI